jgi:predicted nuclease of predicted toxin-antitoxin system
VRLIVDANLAPRIAEALRAKGHDAEHVFEVGMAAAPDPEILAYAREAGRVIVSSDSDFGTLLARSGEQTPSFVLLRRLNERTPEDQVDMILHCLDAAAEHLRAGAVVSVREDRIRVRPLPFGPVGR